MKVLFMTMASPNGLFLKSIVFFICLVGIPAKGLAAMFKSEACVLSPSPFVHLNCGKEFVNIKDAIYSTACGDHACRVHRDNVKCKKGESHECWILVDQIPLVECGNYYSLFLEIHFDCVKELPAHPKAINVDGGASTVSSDRWKMALIVFLLVLK